VVKNKSGRRGRQAGRQAGRQSNNVFFYKQKTFVFVKNERNVAEIQYMTHYYYKLTAANSIVNKIIGRTQEKIIFYNYLPILPVFTGKNRFFTTKIIYR